MGAGTWATWQQGGGCSRLAVITCDVVLLYCCAVVVLRVRGCGNRVPVVSVADWLSSPVMLCYCTIAVTWQQPEGGGCSRLAVTFKLHGEGVRLLLGQTQGRGESGDVATGWWLCSRLAWWLLCCAAAVVRGVRSLFGRPQGRRGRGDVATSWWLCSRLAVVACDGWLQPLHCCTRATVVVTRRELWSL
jgi:hypothetical protein